MSGQGCEVTDPMTDMISVTGTLPDAFTSEDGNTYTWVRDEAETKTEGNVTTYPQTGDNRMPMLWIALMLISGTAIVMTGIAAKKRKHAGK